MNPQLVLKAHHLEAIGIAKAAVVIGQVFRHKEQADAFGARRRTGQTRQDKVADVAAKVIVAPGDIDLLTRDRIGAVAIVFGLGRQRPHVRPRLRFGQVHRAGPFAADQLGQVQLLDRVAGVMLKRFDLALAHQGGKLQGQAGTAHHFVDGGRQGHGQAHAAEFGVGGHADPAAFGHGLEPVRETGRGPYDAVFKLGGGQVAGALQRGQNVIGHLARLFEDRAGDVFAGVLEAVGLTHSVQPYDMIKQKGKIFDRGAIGHSFPPLTRSSAWQTEQRPDKPKTILRAVAARMSLKPAHRNPKRGVIPRERSQ